MAVAVGACLSLGVPYGLTDAFAGTARAARAQGETGGRHGGATHGAPRAPTAPPLNTRGEGSLGADGGEGEAAAGIPAEEADPLVANGLGSPLCKGAFGIGELSKSTRRNCEYSGFVAAVAPTEDYGVDVHINTGVLGLNLDTITQDVIVTPLWMALVWVVHALIVMLEWSFTIDLLDSAPAGGVGAGLRQIQNTITYPWLAGVLAVASVIVLYNGLIRRRVAESIGQAALALAMMVAGMWVILDPTATVGELGAWANQAGVGTLAVTAGGTPAAAGRTLADSMQMVFAAAVESPWCYLEFGNVGWCRDPHRLDPRLRAAGLAIASHELASVGCKQVPELLVTGPQCVSPGSVQARAIERSAQLLRGAQTNGAIFLALPANGPARNSINERESLLRVLCESSESTDCRGATAAEAEFRDGAGTWSRVGGLVLIVGGALGLLLLFGFIALRLLGAAIFSLLYLLLAPAAVLAPALGESGRDVFRKWAVRLLGAVVAKLIYSFALGVLLAVVAILADLGALGWWTQWLLMSAFWWGAYTHRHHALALAGGKAPRDQGGGSRAFTRRRLTGAVSRSAALRGARTAKRVLLEPDNGVPPRGRPPAAGLPRLDEPPGDQAGRAPADDTRETRASVRTGPDAGGPAAEGAERLERLPPERSRHPEAGDTPGAATLAGRTKPVDADGASEVESLRTTGIAVERQGQAHRGGGDAPVAAEQRDARERFLDTQAALVPGVPPRGTGSPGAKPGGRPRGAGSPGAKPGGPPIAPRPKGGEDQPLESSVMRDAREVAARRKRQLGHGRP